MTRIGAARLASALAVAVSACTAGDGLEDFGLSPTLTAPLSPAIPLTIPTPDGSGQAVHPDVVWFPRGWRGWAYWMAFSPYRGARTKEENPSIVVSQDGMNWQVPAGLVNPVLSPPRETGAYNSDPDLSYDAANDRLVLLNREMRGKFNVVSALFSTDGVRWSPPRELFRRPNHGMISPAMVWVAAGKPLVWYVDAGTGKCKKRTTQVMRQEAVGADPLSSAEPAIGWAPPRPAGLAQPGQVIWHLDVTWIEARREFWAVYPAYPVGDCGANDLFIARSGDGLKWTTYTVPLLRHEALDWTRQTLYRASLIYDPPRDVVRVFFSAAAAGDRWRLGYAEFSRLQLFAALERAPLSSWISRTFPDGGAPPQDIGEGDSFP